MTRCLSGDLVVGGIDDPFVESLTHNSIIVQIPRLHGKVNNRLDKVLSIFDQSLRDGKTSHTIDIDADAYIEDSDMQPIIRRLEEAAADSKVRRKMDVEDEFFSVLKSRDTEIMIKDMQLAEKTVAVKEMTDKFNMTKEELGKAEEKLGKAEEQWAQAEEQRVQAEEQRAQAEEQRAQAEEKLGKAEEKLGKAEEKLGKAEEKLGKAEEQRAQAEEQRAQAEEQRAQAEERAERMMRSSVIAFLRQKMPVEDIANILGIDITTVNRIASE
jgi:DNA repair exonuclease SbcCD ATPase subunit